MTLLIKTNWRSFKNPLNQKQFQLIPFQEKKILPQGYVVKNPERILKDPDKILK